MKLEKLLLIFFSLVIFTSSYSQDLKSTPSSLIFDLFASIKKDNIDDYIEKHIKIGDCYSFTYYVAYNQKTSKEFLKNLFEERSQKNRKIVLALADSIMKYDFSFEDLVSEQFDWYYSNNYDTVYTYSRLIQLNFLKGDKELKISLDLVEMNNDLWKVIKLIDFEIKEVNEISTKIKTQIKFDYEPISFGNTIIESLKSNNQEKIFNLFPSKSDLNKYFELKSHKRLETLIDETKENILTLYEALKNKPYQIMFKSMSWDRKSFIGDKNRLKYRIYVADGKDVEGFEFECYPTVEKVFIFKINNIFVQEAIHNSILDYIQKK